MWFPLGHLLVRDQLAEVRTAERHKALRPTQTSYYMDLVILQRCVACVPVAAVCPGHGMC